MLSLTSFFTPGRNTSGQEGKLHRRSPLGGGESGGLSAGSRVSRYAAHAVDSMLTILVVKSSAKVQAWLEKDVPDTRR
jgi:hypothetical protein